GKKDLIVGGRQQVVDVFFFRGPESFDRVVGADAIDRRLVHSTDFDCGGRGSGGCGGCRDRGGGGGGGCRFVGIGRLGVGNVLRRGVGGDSDGGAERRGPRGGRAALNGLAGLLQLAAYRSAHGDCVDTSVGTLSHSADFGQACAIE